MSNSSRQVSFEVNENGLRLDKFLATRLPEFSRSRLQSIIKQGGVNRNSQTVGNPSTKLSVGDIIQFVLPEAKVAEPIGEDIPLNVVFEDNDLIVIDKPAGMVVHPGAGNWTGTMVNALIHHCGESLSGIGGVIRPGIVHRLDKDTSGLLVVAKNDRTHQSLADQFADHGRTNELERVYKLLVWGKPARPKGKIVTDIGRSPQNRVKMAVMPEGKGKISITHYELEESFELLREETGEVIGISLLACRLETGRTHQIRVHMTHLGIPILRDPLYGQHFMSKEKILNDAVRPKLEKLERQALHASVIQFEHPAEGKVMRFESSLPDDMQSLVSVMR